MEILNNKYNIINKVLIFILGLGLIISPSISTAHASAKHKASHVNTEKTKKMTKFRNNYKLMFFFTGACGYCHTFAPVFKKFIIDKKIEVEAITEDGSQISGFKWAEHSPDKVYKYGVESFPTVLVLNKKTNSPDYVFSQGNTSRGQLERNLEALLAGI